MLNIDFEFRKGIFFIRLFGDLNKETYTKRDTYLKELIETSNFKYIVPPTIQNKEDANNIYEYVMHQISKAAKDLKVCGIPKEDIANILPLGMATGISCHYNLRTLENMANQRFCSRAY